MKKTVLFLLILGNALKLVAFHAATKPAEQVETKRQSDASLFGVQKISENLYVGKVADNFYLGMERITSKNITMWNAYIRMQASHLNRSRFKQATNSSGAEYAYRVLDCCYFGMHPDKLTKPYTKDDIISLHDHELWIAYASDIPITGQAEIAPTGDQHIEMFVTVITAPKSLITSHMGISRTYEAAQDLSKKTSTRAKHPYQSIDLHSFAAKVMQLRDPKKKYMLTAPVPHMRNIFLTQMPLNSVFVEDNKHKEVYEDLSEKETKRLKDESPYLLTKEGFTLVLKKDDGSAPFSIDLSKDSAQKWLSALPYKTSSGPDICYVLVDLEKLAAATKLKEVSALTSEEKLKKKSQKLNRNTIFALILE